jgi:predicted Rossmann fold nucleotide-binding protein DprA/Smf involved in DNA uptake
VTSADDVIELLAESRTLVMGAQEAADRARAIHRAERPSRAAAKGSSPSSRTMREAATAAPACSDDAAAILAAVRRLGRAGFDELERELAWTVPRIATAALELELRGMVARDAEGAFRAKSA